MLEHVTKVLVHLFSSKNGWLLFDASDFAFVHLSFVKKKMKRMTRALITQ